MGGTEDAFPEPRKLEIGLKKEVLEPKGDRRKCRVVQDFTEILKPTAMARPLAPGWCKQKQKTTNARPPKRNTAVIALCCLRDLLPSCMVLVTMCSTCSIGSSLVKSKLHKLGIVGVHRMCIGVHTLPFRSKAFVSTVAGSQPTAGHASSGTTRLAELHMDSLRPGASGGQLVSTSEYFRLSTVANANHVALDASNKGVGPQGLFSARCASSAGEARRPKGKADVPLSLFCAALAARCALLIRLLWTDASPDSPCLGAARLSGGCPRYQHSPWQRDMSSKVHQTSIYRPRSECRRCTDHEEARACGRIFGECGLLNDWTAVRLLGTPSLTWRMTKAVCWPQTIEELS